mmetsp:Transcript_30433/g.65542  ORF Transcript_30433/g.65542 Transcript_30433/m.65542 type:complete len:311 (-) Transcript_30433:705-1637(-)
MASIGFREGSQLLVMQLGGTSSISPLFETSLTRSVESAKMLNRTSIFTTCRIRKTIASHAEESIVSAIRPRETSRPCDCNRRRHAELRVLEEGVGAEGHGPAALGPGRAPLEGAEDHEDGGDQQTDSCSIQPWQRPTVERKGPELSPKRHDTETECHTRSHQGDPAQEGAKQPRVAAGEGELHAEEAGDVEEGSGHHLREGDACQENGAVDPVRGEDQHEHGQNDLATSPHKDARGQEGNEPAVVDGRVVDSPHSQSQEADDHQSSHAGREAVVFSGVYVPLLRAASVWKDGRHEPTGQDHGRIQPSRLR